MQIRQRYDFGAIAFAIVITDGSGSQDGTARLVMDETSDALRITENEEHDRLAEPVDNEEPPRLPFPVVGIGGSAGGIESFFDFFKMLPGDPGMAYVLIQHLPPDRDSLLAEILSKRTSLPVKQVEDGMEVEANHVYVIRPGHTLTIKEGKLRLGESLKIPGHRQAVDDFFRSLAEEQRERAICVVMSGMGSNGTMGAQAVKAVGGVCIAQDPESAKFPSMPRSLIDAGLADFVLRPEDMPEILQKYSEHPYAKSRLATASILRRDKNAFGDILNVLRTRSRQEFGGYKKPTVLRRIQRRMGLHQIEDLGDYAKLLRQNTVEATSLADDLVIHVTGFFRDPEAWEILREQVIVPLVNQREDGAPIRVWVTACSSGEEAYTLAILLTEAVEAAGKSLDIKIFATDLAERVLVQARNGVYPMGIESEISPGRLERFFDKDDSTYRIKKEVRELVVFAPQNVLQDPPFSKLDICTCRNLLIYLEADVQQRVLALLHFGLRQGGVLFLGNSETISESENSFEVIDKKWRIFRRVGPARRSDVEFPLLVSPASPTGNDTSRPVALRPSVGHVAQRALLELFSPPAVVVDAQHRVVYYHGETTPFLSQPEGEPTRELLVMAREGVRGAMRIALHKASTENTVATVRDGYLDTPQGRIRIAVTVAPLDQRTMQGYYLVSFEQWREAQSQPRTDNVEETAKDHRRALDELQRVRDELQSAVEELQTSNEELKASNEEVTSVNEELQSTNEELETSKEELQSLNEELTTVNTQLQAKMEELEGTTSDLSSLLSSMDIAVVFLDSKFRIRRFTPPVKDLFDLIPSDIGRPLSDLARKFEDPELLNDTQQVLEKLIPREREITSTSDRWYMRRILPYRTIDNRIDGVVLTFVDITRRRIAESAQREVEEQYRVMVQSVKEYAIIMINLDGNIVVWNLGAERVFGFSETEAIGRHIRLIFTPEDRKAGQAELELSRAKETGQAMDERWHLRRDGSRLWGSGTMTALYDSQRKLRGYAKILRDGTDRKFADEQLREARYQAEAANAAKDQFLATVSHELRTPLSAILL